MNSKTPVKILTLTLFILLLSGFVLYRDGVLFREEKQVAFIPDPNGGAESNSLKDTDFGLTTFQKLKLSGAFDPGNFDTVYNETMHFNESYRDMVFLSSSKSALVAEPERFDRLPGTFKSAFEIQLEEQINNRKPLKKR